MLESLKSKLHQTLEAALLEAELACQELTLYVDATQIKEVCLKLRDEFGFSQLIDLCAVDYADYGGSAWETTQASEHGFSRASQSDEFTESETGGMRFAVVYHLLSIDKNLRLRLKANLPAELPIIDSVISVWRSADWFEREAYDLLGILFDGHPDLRRILTDYGFVGHPLRKDFPLTGYVEMRYDPEQKRVIYEPVSIEPRILVPRVIRDDNRYATGEK
ncbi:NADH-quinone oxidoreductase subunit C [Methylophaga lonarensis]|uniref:NADH-quinone oxidoreductase subunit C n=1 Tax=Methylophaga lonarensis TaxID=999151 RepID=UPI003D26CC2E